MTSWHGEISNITGSLWGETTGPRWIPLTKDQYADFGVLFGWLGQAVERMIDRMKIWDAIIFIWRGNACIYTK